jgi:hypothetical protein
MEGIIGKLQKLQLSRLFLLINEKTKKTVGPTDFNSLFSLSHHNQTREVWDFSPISLSSTSLSPFSPLPNTV